MNPYQNSQRWKFALLIFAAIITATSLIYTNYLVKNLSAAERTKAEVWAMSTRNIFNMPDINDEFTTFIYAIRDSLSMPAIIADSRDSIIYWKGLDTAKTNIDLSEEIVMEGSSMPEYDPD